MKLRLRLTYDTHPAEPWMITVWKRFIGDKLAVLEYLDKKGRWTQVPIVEDK